MLVNNYLPLPQRVRYLMLYINRFHPTRRIHTTCEPVRKRTVVEIARLPARQVRINYLTLYNISHQTRSVWRVTKGPNMDWPLALCDHSTVNTDTDLEFSDVVHRDHVGENCMFYFNPSHRWYFLDEQQTSDVLVFRHTHSKGVQVPCMFPSPSNYISLMAWPLQLLGM